MFAKCNECGAEIDVLSVGEILDMAMKSEAEEATLLIGNSQNPKAAVFFVMDPELIQRVRETIEHYDIESRP